MPGGDGTGPRGMGPMTGRAAGYCAGFPVPGFANPIPGGLALGSLGAYGSGYGAYGYPYGYGAAGYPYAYGTYGAGAPVGYGAGLPGTYGAGAPGGYGAGLPSAPYYGGFMRPRLGLGIGRGRGMGIGRGMRRRW